MELDDLLCVQDVAALLGVSTQTIYRYIARGIFPPAPIRIGPRITKWPRSLVTRWMTQGALTYPPGPHFAAGEASRFHLEDLANGATDLCEPNVEA